MVTTRSMQNYVGSSSSTNESMNKQRSACIKSAWQHEFDKFLYRRHYVVCWLRMKAKMVDRITLLAKLSSGDNEFKLLQIQKPNAIRLSDPLKCEKYRLQLPNRHHLKVELFTRK